MNERCKDADFKGDIDRLTALAAGAGLGLPVSMAPLAAAASSRRYFRMIMADGPTLVGASGPCREENRAFVHISRCLKEAEVAAPEVLAVDRDYDFYIMTDLGDRSMMDVVTTAAGSGVWAQSDAIEALTKCMIELPRLQYRVAATADSSLFYPRPAMDRRTVMWDLNHFKYCFLKAAGVVIDEDALESDFNSVGRMIESQRVTPLWAFIHRDCQSRNVMLTADGDPQWIDFQGGRLGPVAYDVASMVWHARAAIPADVRNLLVDIYMAAWMEETGLSLTREEFDEALYPALLLRFLQVLGAYGLRGITEGKAAFVTPIAAAVDELQELRPWMREAGLDALADIIDALPANAVVRAAAERTDTLTVEVTSFSYKRGLPRDYSGNGGGFLFDCRYLDNPGRYPEYRHLTGMDRPVIEFLEARGEMPRLVEQAIAMVRPAVECYRHRGFTRLTVGFGCTGGQHRSVYGAEAMARALSSMGVRVRLIHREQGIDRIIEPDIAL